MGYLHSLFVGDTDLDRIRKLPIERLQLSKPDEISPKATLLELYEKMIGSAEYLGVVRSGNPGSVVGIITPNDVANYIHKQGRSGKKIDPGNTFADDIMNDNPVSVNEKDTVNNVRAELVDHNFRKILVLDKAKKNPRVITRASLASQIRRKAG